MNNYDSMTVDDLMFEYAEWARGHGGTHWEIRGNQGVVVDDENPLNVVARKHAIIAALRRKVIEEASVGFITFHETFYGGTVTYHTKELVGEADYDLIPKETP